MVSAMSNSETWNVNCREAEGAIGNQRRLIARMKHSDQDIEDRKVLVRRLMQGLIQGPPTKDQGLA